MARSFSLTKTRLGASKRCRLTDFRHIGAASRNWRDERPLTTASEQRACTFPHLRQTFTLPNQPDLFPVGPSLIFFFSFSLSLFFLHKVPHPPLMSLDVWSKLQRAWAYLYYSGATFALLHLTAFVCLYIYVIFIPLAPQNLNLKSYFEENSSPLQCPQIVDENYPLHIHYFFK